MINSKPRSGKSRNNHVTPSAPSPKLNGAAALARRRSSRPKASENVKNGDSANTKKQAFTTAAKLARITFRTSREMDFFSERELVTQTGHDKSEWPLVIAKELIDNSLDACEEADIAPVIEVAADPCGITVRDNGPGLPEATLKGAMDFTVRASNREAYISPCRGAQGNALMTILPMPRVVDPEDGRLIIQAHGKRHVITCGADPISQRAVINDDATELCTCGTMIRVEWASRNHDDGTILWPFNDWRPPAYTFRALLEGFAIFNPHATITLDWFGDKTIWQATNPNWKKWKPHEQTSAHWYEVEHLARLIGAYITYDREAGTDRLVSDFISEFDGLSGSHKRSQVLADADLLRVKLSELAAPGALDNKRIARLLAAMQKHTRPVKPQRLGLIGEDHLRARLLAMGVQPESFRYKKKLSGEALPWVLESAFGWLGKDATDQRKIYAGANWSAAIKNPFRLFGDTGEGLETALADMRATRSEPIVFVLHLAHPRIEYTDRGKSALVIGGAA